MHIRQRDPYPAGYTAITEYEGKHSDMLMDFGMLFLRPGQSYRDERETERSILLLNGDIRLSWDNKTKRIQRKSLFNEAAAVLHLPRSMRVDIEALTDSECALNAVPNQEDFAPVFYSPGGYRSEQFGAGTMQETSTRTVRTVFDAASAEYSQMVLGEVLNYPGKWSSYPPHKHPQPEIYHFRFFPDHGFGFSAQGETVYMVQSRDTVTIAPQISHPQVSAPGYCMYYLWAIPHLPDSRFGPDSRNFVEEHSWLLKEDAPIWEEKK